MHFLKKAIYISLIVSSASFAAPIGENDFHSIVEQSKPGIHEHLEAYKDVFARESVLTHLRIQTIDTYVTNTLAAYKCFLERAIYPLTQIYAWAIPTPAALDMISKYGPIIELGAGTGYWAQLLQQRGVNIVAYDHLIPSILYYNVQNGSIEQLARHKERSLFLSWPPNHTEFAHDALAAYPGNTFIYIGESREGLTGSDSFFDLLAQEWQLVEHLELPNLPHHHDFLAVYQRKGKETLPALDVPLKSGGKIRAHDRLYRMIEKASEMVMYNVPALEHPTLQGKELVQDTDSGKYCLSSRHEFPLILDHRRMFAEARPSPEELPTTCLVCAKPGSSNCGKCKKATYCSRECQRVHWAWHKGHCTSPAAP